jgi:hypothetical protein
MVSDTFFTHCAQQRIQVTTGIRRHRNKRHTGTYVFSDAAHLQLPDALVRRHLGQLRHLPVLLQAQLDGHLLLHVQLSLLQQLLGLPGSLQA